MVPKLSINFSPNPLERKTFASVLVASILPATVLFVFALIVWTEQGLALPLSGEEQPPQFNRHYLK
jgi:hypothetical protein